MKKPLPEWLKAVIGWGLIMTFPIWAIPFVLYIIGVFTYDTWLGDNVDDGGW